MHMHIVHADTPARLKQIMRDIGVDEYGIRIMIPKAIARLVKVSAISNITANILKQEMLSVGGDAAVARGALTGGTSRTDCLLMGSLSHFDRLRHKLQRQPFGLDSIAKELSRALLEHHKETFVLKACGRAIHFNKRPYIMGIINLTPDSFSGDGLNGVSPDYVLRHAHDLIRDGADIIDVGGESTRPGASRLSVHEELARVIPVIRSLAREVKAPISIDTYKPEVARQALANGAVIVNDITGLRQGKMRKVIARARAGAVMMHMRGVPRTMQRNPAYASLLDDILSFFARGMERAGAAGIAPDQIIVDPGLGFGKTLQHNLELLKRLAEFRVLSRPILVGPSRKSFIGKILNLPASARTNGTVGACLAAVAGGAKIVRVHDVKAVKDALRIFDRIQQA